MLKKDTDSFSSLVHLIGTYGGYNPPTEAVSYAMAIAINRCGGWEQVCSWRYKDYPKMMPLFSSILKEVNKTLDNPSATTLPKISLKGTHTAVEISP